MKPISDLIVDPTYGLFSLDKLYRKVKRLGYTISREKLKKMLDEEYYNQVTHIQQKPKKFNQIYAPYPRFNYQIDIVIYDRFKYHNYTSILCVVDVYSRFAACRAMTNREAPNVLKNLKEIFDEIGEPERINADNEFRQAANIKGFFDKEGIRQYYSEANDAIKNGIVERFNRTLITLLNKYRIASGNPDWPKYLQNIVDNYNTTYHSTIKATPFEVFYKQDVSHQEY